MTRLLAGAATDVGRVRQNNEDNLLVSDPLFAVADGMGGHAAGEVASGIAVEILAERFEADHSPAGLAEAVRAANRAVWERSQSDRKLRGMGTTITAVALVEDGGDEVLAVVNVGDSRAYRMQKGELEQLTEDHSLVEELVRTGRISTEEAQVHPQKHVLTRVLGIEAEVDVDCFRVVPYKGDRFLLASDGLFNEVDDAGIASTLRRTADPDEAARTLVDMAKKAGGADNITVVVIDVADDGDRAAKASTAIEDEDTPAVVRALAQRAREVKRSHRLTLRTVLFVGLVALLIVGAVAAIGVFARASYFVGVDNGDVVVYQGRPGGLLWFDPTIEKRTGLTINDVPEGTYHTLREGKEEPSLADARRYVENLRAGAAAMRQRMADSATTSTTERPAIP